MIRKAIMVICILITITCAVLWPVSYWWNPSRYETNQSAPQVGYWGGYAMYDGNLFIAFESLYPPSSQPKIYYSRSIDPASVSGLMKDDYELQEDDIAALIEIKKDLMKQPPVAHSVYDEKEINLAFLGWEFDYDITFKRFSMNTPLPMLVVLFAVISLILGAYNPYIRRRRKKRGECIHCGYNLTGNTTGICPECGNTCDFNQLEIEAENISTG